MLSLARLKVPSTRLSQHLRRNLVGSSAAEEMSKDDIRHHLKRVIENTRDERLEKMKKFKQDWLDSRELKLVVLGNGSAGSPTNVVLHSPARSYLFNCGEGSQKLCVEYKVKVPKISNLFLTSANWKNVGGLPGWLLTAQSVGLPCFGIHGPKVFRQLLDSTERFMKVEYINVYHNDEENFEDQVLRVQRVTLKSSKYKTEDEDPRGQLFAYVCRGYDTPGKLILEKCVEKGVPTGPLFSQLKRGEEIKLANGDVVKPSEVLEPSMPGPVLIVLECPSEDYIDSLLASEAIAAHQNLPGTDEDYHATCVVHMTPKAVYDSEKYQKFVNLFAERTKHLHLCETNTTEISVSSIRRMVRLNQIQNEIFPRLPATKSADLPPMTTILLRKGELTSREDRLEISIEKFVKEAQESENFAEIRGELLKRLESMSRSGRKDYPKVTFLGTGSACPTKDRNVSGILVRPTDSSAFLLDCGENTINQLIHLFGMEKTSKILGQLEFIFLSHIHADHHLGFAGLMLKRKELGITKKLTVIAPSFLPPWLEEFSKHFEHIECHYTDSKDLIKNELPEEILSTFSVSKISTCYVEHCAESFGIRVELGGYSIVYSGDTRPSEKLIAMGKGCDLLIHEATMEDELLNDALIKGHSTTTQAIEVAKQMEAKFTILTHFSQRYAKLPFMDESVFADGRIGMAFDFMTVCPRNLHVLPLIYPMLKCVYSEHYGIMQTRNQKYVGRNQQVSVKN